MAERLTAPHDTKYWDLLELMSANPKTHEMCERMRNIRAAEYDIQLNNLILGIDGLQEDPPTEVIDELAVVCAEIAETYGLEPREMFDVIEAIRIRYTENDVQLAFSE